MELPILIKGNSFFDKRGEVKFINSFDLSSIKRLYSIRNSNDSLIRAWQGHRFESKYFKCITGEFLIALVRVDNWENPSEKLNVDYYMLDSEKNEVLYVPKGFANGILAFNENSELLVFSDKTLKDSKHDQYRFNKDLWCDWEKVLSEFSN